MQYLAVQMRGGYATGKGDSIMKSQELQLEITCMYSIDKDQKIPEWGSGNQSSSHSWRIIYSCQEKTKRWCTKRWRGDTTNTSTHSWRAVHSCCEKAKGQSWWEWSGSSTTTSTYNKRSYIQLLRKPKKTNKIAGDSDCTASSRWYANSQIHSATKTILECQSMH